METKIENINTKVRTLLTADFVTYQTVREQFLKMGVYMIYTSDDKLLYIGSTNNLPIRFMDILHEKSHTFMKKLLANNDGYDRSHWKTFIKTQCKYRIVTSETKNEAEAVEHFAIYLLDPPFNG